MKKLTSVLLSISTVCAIFLATSCKEDDKDPVSPNVELLVAHTWKFNKYNFPTQDPIIQSVAETTAAILTGTEITFRKDGTLLSSFDQSGSGTWSLSTDGKTLTMIETGFKKEFTIATLNETTLVLSEHNDYYNIDITTTYIKK